MNNKAMPAFADRQCEPTSRRSTKVNPDQLHEFAAQFPNCVHSCESDIDQLNQSFGFASYALAVQFVNAVAELAEANDHHPDIRLRWGRVDVRWWTHTVAGVHTNDFIMAAKTDRLAREMSAQTLAP